MQPWVFGRIGAAMVGLAVAVVSYGLLADPRSPLRTRWRALVARYDAEVRRLFLTTTGRRIASMQVAFVGLFGVLGLALGSMAFLLLAALGVVAPRVYFQRQWLHRMTQIEKQLDGWLLLLANALKSTAAIPEALAASATLVEPPIRQELELTLREMRLGSSLSEALEAMAARLGSRTVTAAISTLLIGQRTGGDVPRILDESASTLREMARLEAVLRAKTAEGRAQIGLIAAMPFLVAGGLFALDPEWLAPLTTSFIGQVMLAIAVVSWIAALLLARKIMAFPG